MAPIKKTKTIKLNILDETEVIDAFEIKQLSFDASKSDHLKQKELNAKLSIKKETFDNKYKHPWIDTATEIWRWWEHMRRGKDIVEINYLYEAYVRTIKKTEEEPIKTTKYEKKILLQQLYKGILIGEPEWINFDIINYWKTIDKNRVENLSLGATIKTYADSTYTEWRVINEAESFPIGYEWVFKENVYEVTGNYTDEQARLMILEAFDKERGYFEKLKNKYDSGNLQSSDVYSRPRIPESVRIEVWRRDGGKCARCGSREKLEYDHIVPISKGGSNTARNIELLCEKHNRSKSNNVV